jgi:two-component system LytT family response regulator
MIKILAVDDEPLALQRLRLICRDIEDAEIVGQASSCEDALRQIEETRPNLLLLDIQMRDGLGFDVIERMPRDKAPAVIFVSAFDHYAIRAFEAGVADYVLKPVQFDRLREAIERARNTVSAATSAEQIEELKSVIATLRASMRDGNPRKFETELWIRRNVTGFARVPVESIEWVSSEDDYVRLHTHAGSHLMRASIRGLIERIDPEMFIRIHRKTLVNKAAIKELRSLRLGTMEVVLRSGERLSAGRVYAKHLRGLAATTAA